MNVAIALHVQLALNLPGPVALTETNFRGENQQSADGSDLEAVFRHRLRSCSLPSTTGTRISVAGIFTLC
jgi:hypothetical protein